MKRSFLAALLVSASLGAFAQTQTQNTSNGISSNATKNAPGSAEGLNRKGNGAESAKMKSGVSRNGNSNLSPTGPTNTHGSTSQGSASVQSPGGAGGTNTRASNSRTSTSTGGVKGAQNARNNTANDGGTTGPGATGGNSRNTTRTQDERTSEASTSGSTGGSKRPTSTAGVRKEARTSDRNVSTGYPEPTGPGKPGTPAGNAKGNKGKTGKSENYPQ